MGMKDMITTVASILILSMFLMQFAANQVTYTKIAAVESGLNRLYAEGAEEGSSEVKAYIRTLAEILKIDRDDVEMHIGENHEYEVSVPICGIIGPQKILGIGDDDYVLFYTAER